VCVRQRERKRERERECVYVWEREGFKSIAASMLAFPESVDLQMCVCEIERVCV